VAEATVVLLCECSDAAWQMQHDLGDLLIAMAKHIAFMQEVSGDRLDAQRANTVEVCLNGRLSEAGVLLQRGGQDRRRVDDGVVEDLSAGVVEDFFDVLRGGETERLVGLGHQVADVDARG